MPKQPPPDTRWVTYTDLLYLVFVVFVVTPFMLWTGDRIYLRLFGVF